MNMWGKISKAKKKKVCVSDIMAKKIWLGRSIRNFILFWNFISLFNADVTLLSSRCRVSICWPFKSVSHQKQTCIPAKYHGRNHLSPIKRADSFSSPKKDREISQNRSALAPWSRERRHFGSFRQYAFRQNAFRHDAFRHNRNLAK